MKMARELKLNDEDLLLNLDSLNNQFSLPKDDLLLVGSYSNMENELNKDNPLLGSLNTNNEYLNIKDDDIFNEDNSGSSAEEPYDIPEEECNELEPIMEDENEDPQSFRLTF